ncbi:MAG TPA: peptide-methionine (S)-S-oxide reductase MsrA [Thermoanaerobaculia bacterium]|nr:peptide-methionine (S)-S-oxide reductase MsrA [Thermoanaerobaculia bacterium]
MKGHSTWSWLALAGLLFAAGTGVAGAAQPAAPAHPVAKATFAAGCFWCVEEAFDKVPGVISTTSGYTGGSKKNPTYEEVSAGGTGHAESVEVAYDPTKVTYEKLLDAFWHNVDPLVKDRQFCDSGHQYRSAIFYHDETQKKLAEASKAEVQKRFKEPIQTEIVPATQFWPAEEYHQDFYKKNPLRYKFYRSGCGRDRRLQELWGTKGE